MSKEERHIPNFINGLLGGLASVNADLFTFPIDNVKTRLQMFGKQGLPEYKGTWDCIKTTWRTEKIKGFYRGLSANCCRQMTYSTLRVYIYNDVKKMSRGLRNMICSKQMTEEDDITIFEKFLAGGIGGSIGILVGNPFDVYKIRMINDVDIKNPQYSGLRDCMKQSFAQEVKELKKNQIQEEEKEVKEVKKEKRNQHLYRPKGKSENMARIQRFEPEAYDFVLYKDEYPNEWLKIKEYYGLQDKQLGNYLVGMKESGKSLYLVNQDILDALKYKFNTAKVGIKIFSKIRSDDDDAIPYKISQQGITSISKYTNRIVDCALQDLNTILEGDNINIDKEKLSKQFQEATKNLKRGSFIARFKHQGGELLLSLWNGNSNICRFFNKHYLDFFRHLFPTLQNC